jgi:hypothetical protein
MVPGGRRLVPPNQQDMVLRLGPAIDNRHSAVYASQAAFRAIFDEHDSPAAHKLHGSQQVSAIDFGKEDL